MISFPVSDDKSDGHLYLADERRGLHFLSLAEVEVQSMVALITTVSTKAAGVASLVLRRALALDKLPPDSALGRST